MPAQINLGGRHRIAVHQLSDGRRIADTLGPDDSSIQFSGIFTGPDATARARMLDALRIEGGQLMLAWDVFLFNVVISAFHAEYQQTAWIPFSVQCTVIQDDAAIAPLAAASLVEVLLADAQAAGGPASGIGLDLSSVASALTSPAATTRGTTNYNLLAVSIANQQMLVQHGVAAAETSLDSCYPEDGSPVPVAVKSILGSTIAAERLCQFLSLKAYLGRMAGNLENAST